MTFGCQKHVTKRANVNKLLLTMRRLLRFITSAGALSPLLASASIVSISSGDTLIGNRLLNLIQNGSFEADAGFATNYSAWATGTTQLPAMSITGWQASGQSGSYAIWGNDGSSKIVGSEVMPDGPNGVYFGGGIMGAPSPMPTVAANGIVTFSSTPVFSPKPNQAPVMLWQTVSGLNTSQTYLLDFWTSGEDATAPQFADDGIFGLDITGESTMYFSAPSSYTGLGTSQRYYVMFQPTASTVTFTWTNWGHYITPNGLSTELVLDDVILNVQAVPEPATLAVLGAGALALLRRRKA